MNYLVKNKKSDMDLERVHSWIAGSYWAKDIPLDVMAKAIENSDCFGVFTKDNEQVGLLGKPCISL